MNLQQVANPPRSASNGYGRRRVERENVSKQELKPVSGKTKPSRLTNAGETN